MSEVDKKELEDGYFIDHKHCIASELAAAGVERFKGKAFEECGSSDGHAVYIHDLPEGGETFSGFCWSCKQNFTPEHIGKSSLAEELGMETDGVVTEKKDFVRKEKQKALTKEEVRDLIKSIGYESGNYRGIDDEYSKFFGHLTQLDSNGNVTARYYPETNGGEMWPVGYKTRLHPKNWNKLGKTGMSNELSGQSKFKSGGKWLLIVGGEEDKTAAFQMLREDQIRRKQEEFDPIPVVSGTCGEGNLAKQVANNYDFCDSFDVIVVGVDNDEVGLRVAKEVAEVLPKEKVRIAKWGMKDPNLMLQKGKQKQFVRDFYSAKEFMPTEIKHSADAFEDALDFLTAGKISLPPYLHKLQTNMRGGIKTTGFICNLIGDTSIGKSLFTDSLLYYWFWHSPLVPTVVSLERTTGELTVDFLSMHLHKNLAWFENGKDAIDYINRPENTEKVQDLLQDEQGNSRYHVLDERSGDVASLKACVERSIKQYGSRLIIFDPLTDFLRSLGTEAQEDFMMWQKQKKKEGVVFINVLHTRKPSPDKDGKIRKVTEYDALGSGTFVQSADCNIVINRDKMAECPVERNTTTVDMPKIRGGTTGHALDLYYDHQTRQLYDKDDYFGDTGSTSDLVSTEEQEEVTQF